jgi:hypothetical protein
MVWLHYVSYFFGGLFLTNAIPHGVSGMMGQPFQSPFAKPPGEGLSSSTVNVVWAAFNAVLGYVLLLQVGDFDIRNAGHVAAAAVPSFAMALGLARHFGRFHGGRDPR